MPRREARGTVPFEAGREKRFAPASDMSPGPSPWRTHSRAPRRELVEGVSGRFHVGAALVYVAPAPEVCAATTALEPLHGDHGQHKIECAFAMRYAYVMPSATGTTRQRWRRLRARLVGRRLGLLDNESPDWRARNANVPNVLAKFRDPRPAVRGAKYVECRTSWLGACHSLRRRSSRSRRS